MSTTGYLSRSQEYALTATAAVVTANAYYIHPIIGDVAQTFGVGEAEIGLVPALNQFALAIGIFLLLPLGDRYSNRSLCVLFVALQTLSMLMMAWAETFVLFTLASTTLGFFTIAPYLLPAYASKRVAPERLGQVTALLTTGVIFGILAARVGGGALAEFYGWRLVYWIASGLMLTASIALPLLMEKRSDPQRAPAMRYHTLLASVFALARDHREVLVSASIQGLNFGMFTATWLALALHLTAPEMGYGTDTVGYLAGIAIISLAATPRIGRWSDRVGPRRARFRLAFVQLCGTLLFYPLGFGALPLVVPLLFVNAVGPSIDVTSRMTFLALAPDIRTRLTTIFIVMMFIGGGVGSFAGTASYAWGGWAATCALIVGASLMVMALSALSVRKWGAHEARSEEVAPVA